ncbi:hypothetical protein like AT5G42930 [Hibiscus trionum]|uniref:Uncharacterized protein n=1 Tax=Hibiscus trionum TaxID=183268 RepID=A0A9W7LV94_HIBTR|nr:hypothetical protein like AT5G42930 [Hibiscus trionum]
MASDDNLFYDDCFIIHPEDTTYFDLLGLLLSSKLGRRRFARRWIIFLSLLLHKLFWSMRIPLLLMKNTMEMSLNLLSHNRGLFGLSFKFLTGKVVWPHRSSAKFKSIIGFTDPRVELDSNIKPGDTKYKALLCMMSAKFSYESEAYIKTNITQHWK